MCCSDWLGGRQEAGWDGGSGGQAEEDSASFGLRLLDLDGTLENLWWRGLLLRLLHHVARLLWQCGESRGFLENICRRQGFVVVVLVGDDGFGMVVWKELERGTRYCVEF